MIFLQLLVCVACGVVALGMFQQFMFENFPREEILAESMWVRMTGIVMLISGPIGLITIITFSAIYVFLGGYKFPKTLKFSW